MRYMVDGIENVKETPKKVINMNEKECPNWIQNLEALKDINTILYTETETEYKTIENYIPANNQKIVIKYSSGIDTIEKTRLRDVIVAEPLNILVITYFYEERLAKVVNLVIV